MTSKDNRYRKQEIIGLWDRSVRIALGAALIGIAMTASETPLGWIAVLPLLAVYPVLTGVVGRDPLRSALHAAAGMRRHDIALQHSLTDTLPPAVLDTRTPQPLKAA